MTNLATIPPYDDEVSKEMKHDFSDADLIAVSTTHTAFDGSDGDMLEGYPLSVLDEDAAEQPDEVLCVYDRVRLVRRHRHLDREHEAVIPLLVARRYLLRDPAVRGLVLPTEQHCLRCHLAALEVDQLLEAESNYVGIVDARECVMQEVDVLGRAGKSLRLRRVEVPGDDEHFHWPEGAELRLAFHQFLVYVRVQCTFETFKAHTVLTDPLCT